jgi:hypothetical protein
MCINDLPINKQVGILGGILLGGSMVISFIIGVILIAFGCNLDIVGSCINYKHINGIIQQAYPYTISNKNDDGVIGTDITAYNVLYDLPNNKTCIVYPHTDPMWQVNEHVDLLSNRLTGGCNTIADEYYKWQIGTCLLCISIGLCIVIGLYMVVYSKYKQISELPRVLTDV